MGAKCANNESGIGVKVLHLEDIDALMAVVIAGTTATISITVPGGGIYWFDCFLSDSATGTTESVNLPSSNIVHWTGHTDSNGLATISIQNTNASRTWYMRGRMQKSNVSAAITVGV